MAADDVPGRHHADDHASQARAGGVIELHRGGESPPICSPGSTPPRTTSLGPTVRDDRRPPWPPRRPRAPRPVASLTWSCFKAGAVVSGVALRNGGSRGLDSASSLQLAETTARLATRAKTSQAASGRSPAPRLPRRVHLGPRRLCSPFPGVGIGLERPDGRPGRAMPPSDCRPRSTRPGGIRTRNAWNVLGVDVVASSGRTGPSPPVLATRCRRTPPRRQTNRRRSRGVDLTRDGPPGEEPAELSEGVADQRANVGVGLFLLGGSPLSTGTDRGSDVTIPSHPRGTAQESHIPVALRRTVGRYRRRHRSRALHSARAEQLNSK